MSDNINHPEHYTKPVPGVETIEVAQHFNFCLGNVIKYVWRFKADGFLEDLKKARWYLNQEIARREESASEDCSCLTGREVTGVMSVDDEAELSLNKQRYQELRESLRKDGVK